MPPRMQRQSQRAQRPRGYDPTVSVTAAAAAKQLNTQEGQNMQDTKEITKQENQENQNEDLKKLIETLRNKMGIGQSASGQKRVPPSPEPRTAWNRSFVNAKSEKEQSWNAKPAYTILTRISNHEKVPAKSVKLPDLTINSLPHAFLYRPGIDGIKVDKLNVKAGRQLGIG